MEKFDSNPFPPSGWSTYCYNDYGSSYGCWGRGTGYAGGGMSGTQAQSVYGDYSLADDPLLAHVQHGEHARGGGRDGRLHVLLLGLWQHVRP